LTSAIGALADNDGRFCLAARHDAGVSGALQSASLQWLAL